MLAGNLSERCAGDAYPVIPRRRRARRARLGICSQVLSARRRQISGRSSAVSIRREAAVKPIRQNREDVVRSAAERVSCGEARGATAALRLASEVAAPLRDYREDPPAPGPTLTSSSPGQLTSLEKSVNDTTSSRVYLDTEGFDSCGRPIFRKEVGESRRDFKREHQRVGGE